MRDAVQHAWIKSQLAKKRNENRRILHQHIQYLSLRQVQSRLFSDLHHKRWRNCPRQGSKRVVRNLFQGCPTWKTGYRCNMLSVGANNPMTLQGLDELLDEIPYGKWQRDQANSRWEKKYQFTAFRQHALPTLWLGFILDFTLDFFFRSTYGDDELSLSS